MEGSDQFILFILTGVGIMLLLSLGFVLFFYFSQTRLRNTQQRAQQARLQHQKQMLHSNLTTQEKERARIAKDLHDEVGSKLNVVHLYLHQLLRKMPESQDSVNDILGVIGDTIQTTRRISHDLLPPTLENFGLGVAIEELIEKLEQSEALPTEFIQEGQRPEHLPTMVELNLFRIVQELISNTLKYADADQVQILLRQSPHKLTLQYRDNGRGYDATDPRYQKGLGTQNIQSRVQMLQGRLALQTAPQQGVKVTLEVPLQVDNPS